MGKNNSTKKPKASDSFRAPFKAENHETAIEDRLRTGSSGLDDILGGGLPKGHLYLVEGDPGTGKTTLALQFLLEGTGRGERGMYITLSESKLELEQVAASHGWRTDSLPFTKWCRLTRT
jgi:circadian clock protein KaiC